jgi:hypothetical protein
MSIKVLQINREVMGRYPSHASKRFLPITMAGLLAVTLSGSAMALPNDASGNLDLNSNGLPRLSPDICYAANSVNAIGSSNFPVGFCLFSEMGAL